MTTTTRDRQAGGYTEKYQVAWVDKLPRHPPHLRGRPDNHAVSPLLTELVRFAFEGPLFNDEVARLPGVPAFG